MNMAEQFLHDFMTKVYMSEWKKTFWTKNAEIVAKLDGNKKEILVRDDGENLHLEFLLSLIVRKVFATLKDKAIKLDLNITDEEIKEDLIEVVNFALKHTNSNVNEQAYFDDFINMQAQLLQKLVKVKMEEDEK